jgi:rod shape-determining protein MreD
MNPSHKTALEAILRPVNPLFVFFTLLCGLMFNLLPWGAWVWSPDWVALTILFWAVREPRLVGFGLAFFLGLLMDTHDAQILGEHAMGYILLAFSGVMLSKRLPSFDTSYQTLHILPVLFVANGLIMLVHNMFGNTASASWAQAFISPALTGLLWPLASWLMLAPQRRSVDVDLNRPL